jgi:hypothetical protein
LPHNVASHWSDLGAADDSLPTLVSTALTLQARVSLGCCTRWFVSSLLQIPLKRIPLTSIETVDATVLRPQEWGGWGYRVMRGRSAFIKGKIFAISLNDPEEPAALLQAQGKPMLDEISGD